MNAAIFLFFDLSIAIGGIYCIEIEPATHRVTNRQFGISSENEAASPCIDSNSAIPGI
jgi:hypothetical protein